MLFRSVLWPAGFAGHFDLPAALIAVAAGIALFRYRANVIHVILVSAGLGLLLRLLA